MAIKKALSPVTVKRGHEKKALLEKGLPEHEVEKELRKATRGSGQMSRWRRQTDLEKIGLYEIGLTGVVSMPIPGPGGLAVIGLAMLGRRRRR